MTITDKQAINAICNTNNFVYVRSLYVPWQFSGACVRVCIWNWTAFARLNSNTNSMNSSICCNVYHLIVYAQRDSITYTLEIKIDWGPKLRATNSWFLRQFVEIWVNGKLIDLNEIYLSMWYLYIQNTWTLTAISATIDRKAYIQAFFDGLVWSFDRFENYFSYSTFMFELHEPYTNEFFLLLIVHIISVGENQKQRLALNTIIGSSIICLSNQNAIS